MSSYINQATLEQSLYFSLPYDYNGLFKIYPIKMSQILEYKTYVQSILVRKDSIFPVKQILRLDYFDFLKFIDGNIELEFQYQVPNLHLFYQFFVRLLTLVCQDENQIVQYNDATKEIAIMVKIPSNHVEVATDIKTKTLGFMQVIRKIIDLKGDTPDVTKYQNQEEKLEPKMNVIKLTGEMVDDIRRIIIAQNDEDFDIQEFMNRETEERLNKAQRDLNPNEQAPTIEDRIDSLTVGLHMNIGEIRDLTIRKFNRLLKRVITYEEYKTSTLALKTGMVKFKEPIKHWTSPIEVEDKYKHVKTDESELRNKIQ